MTMSLEDALETRMQTHWPHRVDIRSDNKADEMREWCEKNCKQDFTILFLGRGLHIARFKSNRDMVLFSLTWS